MKVTVDNNEHSELHDEEEVTPSCGHQFLAALSTLAYALPNTVLYGYGFLSFLMTLIKWIKSDEELDDTDMLAIYVTTAITYLPLFLKTTQRYFSPTLRYISGTSGETHCFRSLDCPRVSSILFAPASATKTLGVSASIFSAISGWDNSSTTKIIGISIMGILLPTNGYTQAATLAQADNKRFPLNVKLFIFDPKNGAHIYAFSNTILTALPPVKFFGLLNSLPVWARVLLAVVLGGFGLLLMPKPSFNESYKWNIDYSENIFFIEHDPETAGHRHALLCGIYKALISGFFPLLLLQQTITKDPTWTAISIGLFLAVCMLGIIPQAGLYAGKTNPKFDLNVGNAARLSRSPIHTPKSTPKLQPHAQPTIYQDFPSLDDDAKNGKNSDKAPLLGGQKRLCCTIL